MTLLADPDVWAVTLDVLRTEGGDVVTAAEIGLAQAPDRTLLKEAAARQRLLLTRDRDFGRLVFAEGYQAGVLFLRIAPSTQETVHAEMCRVLANHSFGELRHTFAVVEPGQHRVRRPS